MSPSAALAPDGGGRRDEFGDGLRFPEEYGRSPSPPFDQVERGEGRPVVFLHGNPTSCGSAFDPADAIAAQARRAAEYPAEELEVVADQCTGKERSCGGDPSAESVNLTCPPDDTALAKGGPSRPENTEPQKSTFRPEFERGGGAGLFDRFVYTDVGSWGPGIQLQETSELQVHAIIAEIAERVSAGGETGDISEDAAKIAALYACSSCCASATTATGSISFPLSQSWLNSACSGWAILRQQRPGYGAGHGHPVPCRPRPLPGPGVVVLPPRNQPRPGYASGVAVAGSCLGEYQRDQQPGSWQLTIRWPSLPESLANWQSHGFHETMTLPGPHSWPREHFVG